MTGICAALRCGLVACAIGAPVMAAMLFAAAPAGAGLLRNAPGVGAVALAHRSLNENLLGGLTGAFKKSVEGFFSDDSGEVEAAWDDAAHAVGKTARDMIPGAWLLDRVGKRVKTAAENIRGFFGDARAALDPAGQAEAEVLDGDSLARPAVRPPPRQRAGETARQAGRSTGNDAWTEVMNERAPAPVDGDGAQRPTSGVPGGESMNERAGEAPRSGRGSQLQAGNDVSAGGDDWNELMNEWAEADPPGGGGSQRQAGNDISTGGDAWAEVMNERPGAGAPTGGGGADRSTGGDAWAEVMNERPGAGAPTGGGSERPMESDVRAGNGGAREETGNEGAAADRAELAAAAGDPRDAEAQGQEAESEIFVAVAADQSFVVGRDHLIFGFGDSVESAMSAVCRARGGVDGDLNASCRDEFQGRWRRILAVAAHACVAVSSDDVRHGNPVPLDTITRPTRERAATAAMGVCQRSYEDSSASCRVRGVECAGLAKEAATEKEAAAEYVGVGIFSPGISTNQEWTFATGDSMEAAASAAKERCEHLYGTTERCWSTSSIAPCIAVAEAPIVPEYDGRYYRLGGFTGAGRTEDEAASVAIQQCRWGIPRSSFALFDMKGDNSRAATAARCHVPDGSEENPSVVCVAGEADDAGPGEYGGLAAGRSGKRIVWAFESGDSEAAAASAAMGRCAPLAGDGNCEASSDTAPSCGAIAVSACPEGCSHPAYGIAGGSTRQEAITNAVAACERLAPGSGYAGTCRVSPSGDGEPGVMCFGVE